MAVYDALVQLWQGKITPEHWKIRWLVPIPKVDDPDISQLRPLMLIDALRKIWFRATTFKIQQAWKEHKLIHANQHGCVRGRSTDTATLETYNSLETGKENRSEVLVSSWDMSHAFDTVSKPLCVYALVRLGIPEDTAAYIVGMDVNGQVIVRSPLALERQRKGFPVADLSFLAIRGTGQGDVVSALIWTAVYDMLLCALADVTEGGLQTRDRFGTVRATHVAYADDLISIQGNLESLQEKADIISGFCIVCGLSLATQKFRAFGLRWGNQWATHADSVTIHTQGWLPIVVPLLEDGTLTHLGRTWDMFLNSANAAITMSKYCEDALTYVIRRKASADTKLLAIKLCILPKVVYTPEGRLYR
jgi:hypothetical protein